MDEERKTEDLSDEELEKTLDEICALVEKSEGRSSILDPMRYRQIDFSFEVIRRLTKDNPDVRVFYKLHEPFNSTGYIALEGKDLRFLGSKWFSRAASFADSVEVYPLVNGNVRMNLTFNGLTKPIE